MKKSYHIVKKLKNVNLDDKKSQTNVKKDMKCKLNTKNYNIV